MRIIVYTVICFTLLGFSSAAYCGEPNWHPLRADNDFFKDDPSTKPLPTPLEIRDYIKVVTSEANGIPILDSAVYNYTACVVYNLSRLVPFKKMSAWMTSEEGALYLGQQLKQQYISPLDYFTEPIHLEVLPALTQEAVNRMYSDSYYLILWTNFAFSVKDVAFSISEKDFPGLKLAVSSYNFFRINIAAFADLSKKVASDAKTIFDAYMDPDWKIGWNNCIDVAGTKRLSEIEEKNFLSLFQQCADFEDEVYQIAIDRIYYVFDYDHARRDEIIKTAQQYYAKSLFSDVEYTDWYFKFLSYLLDHSIIQGYPDQTFRPHNTINRVEFIKMLTLALELKYGEVNISSQLPSAWGVDTSQWYYPYLLKAFNYSNPNYNNQSLLYWPTNTLPPSTNPNPWAELVTREEAAHFVMNAKQLSPSDICDRYFSDSGSLIIYKDWIYSLVNNNIMHGYSDQHFDPLGQLTRAEACKLIYLLIKNNEWFGFAL